MNKPEIISSPSSWELFRLRIMILAGSFIMFLFLSEVFKAKAEYPILYYMLTVTIVYNCSRLIHEWIHYFYITVPPTKPSVKVYSVDIFTTFCKGEPYAMIEETLLAIINIKYPHQSYLCDESDDPFLKQLCDELGVNHVTRTDKKNAKAGNINNALQISSGELCVVLDPDHVPQPNFLDPIVAHFDDEKIGFVQIVQSYKNYGESLVAKGAAQQTFQFYGPIMMTMNKYGTVLAIGANCTFRRKALDSIGGHAAGLAEDMNTAMHLHAKGWKSVYVPQILARGLVPSTMSAYYAQQLKWSRGVFELLVTSYPKLFKGFTWQQKIHYAFTPLYYLSGIIFLLNLSIPILSLAFNTSPINIDFLYFMLYAGPLVLLSFLIRLFVQRWVMEEEERGFHVVGGLLMIGTWWIFLLGVYYTILRKKVPYTPTPKDGHEENNWKINIPNITVIIASILAIIYGLNQDWNPYNLIMSGFAMVNCLILSFSVYASRQAYFRSLSRKNTILNASFTKVSAFKKQFWLLRRFLYRQVRQTALFITILITGFMAFWWFKGQYITHTKFPGNYNKSILIPGIFAPSNTSGLSSVKQIHNIEDKNNLKFGIVSLYLSWGNTDKCKFPTVVLDSIYQNGAIPMITWEPWQSLFKQSEKRKPEDVELNVFKRIVEHQYDAYLEGFATQLKALNKSVFLRFAHETDNPQYPWGKKETNSAEEFKQAWKYIHSFFNQRRVNNVVWVWNPWKPEAVTEYFPGKEFVDWIGVTNLDYNIQGIYSLSMEQLYNPFHKNKIFRSGIPVMLAEMGTLRAGEKQNEWFENASSVLETKFPEVKAFILFNSAMDLNLPKGFTDKILDWKIYDYNTLRKLTHSKNNHNSWLSTDTKLIQTTAKLPGTTSKKLAFLNNIKGVNYKKGQNWSSNGQVLKRKYIVKDMLEIKQMGFNTIKIYGFSIYDNNILEVAKAKNLNVVFSFWLPDNISFISDADAMDDYADKILTTIKKFKNKENIVMWNIANNPMTSLRYKNFKPDLHTEQRGYFSWMHKLIKDIKDIDNSKPISLDIYVDENYNEDYQLLSNAVTGIDCFGLVENLNPKIQAQNFNYPTFMSSISVKSYLKKGRAVNGVFISDWQDEKTINYVSLNGIKDNTGKYKIESLDLSNKWNGTGKQTKIPLAKILLPAATTWPNTQVVYHALLSDGKNWSLINQDKNLSFRWEIIKYDNYKNPVKVTDIGNGTQVSLNIPEEPLKHKIRLYVSKGSIVEVIESKLSIPLIY